MSGLILAQAIGGGSLVSWAIYCVVLAAIVAVILVALRTMGIAVPDFVVRIVWILVVAVLCIAAIAFLARLAGLR